MADTKKKTLQPFMGQRNPRDARKEDITLIRRQFVAELSEQGLTLEQIHKALKKPDSDYHSINPETEKAWSKSTILSDMKVLMEQSQEKMLVETRRNRVRRLRLRGFTLTEIHTAMAKPGSKSYFPNPHSGQPYSLKTIQRDIEHIRAYSIQKASEDIDVIRARLLAEIQEVKAAAWSSNKLGIVLKAISDESKLMGANAPEVQQHNHNFGEEKSAKESLRDKISKLMPVVEDDGSDDATNIEDTTD